MLREGISEEGVAEAEDQKFQDIHQKPAMFIDQYWTVIKGQTPQWKAGEANFKADGSASSFHLEVYWSVKRWTAKQ